MKISASGIMSLAALAAVGGALWYARDWLKKNGDKFMPQSASEKKVNDLYGPGQGWKKDAVYNTPGKPGYFPTLPASYRPGTPSSAMTIPPGVIEANMAKRAELSRTLTISTNPFDPGAQTNAGAAALDTASMIMYGLGEIGAARFHSFGHGRRRKSRRLYAQE